VMWVRAVLTRQFRRVNAITATPPSQPVRRTDHTAAPTIEDMRVNHGGPHISVAKEFLSFESIAVSVV